MIGAGAFRQVLATQAIAPLLDTPLNFFLREWPKIG